MTGTIGLDTWIGLLGSLVRIPHSVGSSQISVLVDVCDISLYLYVLHDIGFFCCDSFQLFSMGYMGGICTCGHRLSLPRFQPWEKRAWWWSRFKEPPRWRLFLGSDACPLYIVPKASHAENGRCDDGATSNHRLHQCCLMRTPAEDVAFVKAPR